MKWISLQNLIGGFALGAEKAFGVPPVAIIHQGWPHDQHYIQYMNDVHKNDIPVIKMNGDFETFASEADEELYNKYVKNESFDVAIMTPVCAGLSMLNACNCESSSKKRGDPNNDQNQNMYNLTKLGMRLDAKVVAFENAPAAYTASGAGVVDRLKEIAESFDYSTHLYKTDTILHGLPQSRKRTFIMFYKDGKVPLFEFEKVNTPSLATFLDSIDTSAPYYDLYLSADAKDIFYEFVLYYTKTKTFKEALGHLGITKNATALGLTQHIGFDKAIDYYQNKLDETAEPKYERAIKTSKHCANKIEMGKGYWDSSTYLANNGEYINALISKNIHRILHPTKEHGLNVREYLSLMGHPEDYIMNNPEKNYGHITQNVPVTTGKFISKQIKKYLDGELTIAPVNFLKQDNMKQVTDTKFTIVQENW